MLTQRARHVPDHKTHFQFTSYLPCLAFSVLNEMINLKKKKVELRVRNKEDDPIVSLSIVLSC